MSGAPEDPDAVFDDGDIPDDAARFMQRNFRTFMITLRKDGSPTAHPMAGFYGDGNLFLNVYAKSAKARNLGRDDRICCLVTTPAEADDFDVALYKGVARQLSLDEVFAERVKSGLAWARNPRSQGSQDEPEIPDESERKIGETAGRIKAGKRVIFEISPDEVGKLSDVREATTDGA